MLQSWSKEQDNKLKNLIKTDKILQVDGNKTTGIEQVQKTSVSYKGIYIREVNTQINFSDGRTILVFKKAIPHLLIYSSNSRTEIKPPMYRTCGEI